MVDQEPTNIPLETRQYWAAAFDRGSLHISYLQSLDRYRPGLKVTRNKYDYFQQLEDELQVKGCHSTDPRRPSLSFEGLSAQTLLQKIGSDLIMKAEKAETARKFNEIYQRWSDRKTSGPEKARLLQHQAQFYEIMKALRLSEQFCAIPDRVGLDYTAGALECGLITPTPQLNRYELNLRSYPLIAKIVEQTQIGEAVDLGLAYRGKVRARGGEQFWGGRWNIDPEDIRDLNKILKGKFRNRFKDGIPLL